MNGNLGNIVFSKKIGKVLMAVLNAPQLDQTTIYAINDITDLKVTTDAYTSHYNYTYTNYYGHKNHIILLHMHIHLSNEKARVTIISKECLEVTDIPRDSWEYICWLLEDKAYDEKKRLEKIESKIVAEKSKPEEKQDKKKLEQLEKETELILYYDDNDNDDDDRWRRHTRHTGYDDDYDYYDDDDDDDRRRRDDEEDRRQRDDEDDLCMLTMMAAATMTDGW